MADETGDMVKIAFEVGDEDTGLEVETLWATPLGGDLYRLENSPWFAYGVSFLDIVRAKAQDEGLLEFEEVVEKSGNRTIRIVLDPPAEEADGSAAILNRLLALGASFEGANTRYMALNIEPEADFHQICVLLTGHSVQWEYADPTYDELFPEGTD
jgi:hypothetical protein